MQKMPIVFQKRGGAVRRRPAGGGVLLFVAPQRRLPHLYRLEHPGPALRPYGGDAGPAEGQLLRLPGKPAAGAHPLHPHPGVPAGVFALCVQHGHHQRRVPHRLCALRHRHPPHGRAGAAAGAPGDAADHRTPTWAACSPPWATPKTCTSTTSPAWGSVPSAGCCSPMCWPRPCCWRCPSCC